MKYNHPEAFKLMKYECGECGYVETLHNTRDGVTPYAISCNKCECPAYHQLHTTEPTVVNYIPPINSRVIVSISEDMVDILTDKIFARYTKHSKYNGIPTRDNLRESIVNRIGAPTAMVVDEYYLKKYHPGTTIH